MPQCPEVGGIPFPPKINTFFNSPSELNQKCFSPIVPWMLGAVQARGNAIAIHGYVYLGRKK